MQKLARMRISHHEYSILPELSETKDVEFYAITTSIFTDTKICWSQLCEAVRLILNRDGIIISPFADPQPCEMADLSHDRAMQAEVRIAMSGISQPFQL